MSGLVQLSKGCASSYGVSFRGVIIPDFRPCFGIQDRIYLTIALVIEENGLSLQYWTDSPFSSITTAHLAIPDPESDPVKSGTVTPLERCYDSGRWTGSRFGSSKKWNHNTSEVSLKGNPKENKGHVVQWIPLTGLGRTGKAEGKWLGQKLGAVSLNSSW